MELKIGDLVRVKDTAIFPDDIQVGDLAMVDAFEGEDLVRILFFKKDKIRHGLCDNKPEWLGRFLEKEEEPVK